MTVIKATVKNGKIELEAPVNWPEGTEVRIEPITIDSLDEETPERIASDLALMEQFEPMEFTVEEQAGWDAARAVQKDREKARFDEHADTLRKIWE